MNKVRARNSAAGNQFAIKSILSACLVAWRCGCSMGLSLLNLDRFL
jgi:hypothetical protein